MAELTKGIVDNYVALERSLFSFFVGNSMFDRTGPTPKFNSTMIPFRTMETIGIRVRIIFLYDRQEDVKKKKKETKEEKGDGRKFRILQRLLRAKRSDGLDGRDVKKQRERRNVRNNERARKKASKEIRKLCFRPRTKGGRPLEKKREKVLFFLNDRQV